MLEGITRKTAIELAEQAGYTVIQGDVSPALAHQADELFATSTAGGIMPITTIDKQMVGNGSIGPITQQLQTAYWQCHQEDRYTTIIE